MKRREIIRQLTAKNIAHDANGNKADLLALLANPANKITKLVNYADGRGKIQVTFNAAKPEEPVEILINEEIGKDPWSGAGLTVNDLENALKDVPRNRQLDVLTNSPGGYVNEGKAIRAWFMRWPGKITNTIIGIAASTASWCIPADETNAYKASQLYLHRSMCLVMGNADDMREAISQMEVSDDQIAEMYADQSGGKSSEFLDLMKAETLLTGQQAKELGLVDNIIDGEAKNQFTPEWLNAAKLKLAALNSLRSAPGSLPGQGERNTNNQQQEINMIKKLALLNKRGITVPENADEAKLDVLISNSEIGRALNISILKDWNVQFDAENSTDAALTALVKNGKPAIAPVVPTNGLSAEDKSLIDGLRNQVAAQRRKEVRNALERLASADGGMRITVNSIDGWEKEALAATDGPEGNPILKNLATLHAQEPGMSPISNVIELKGEDFKDVQKYVLANSTGFRSKFIGRNAGKMEVDKAVLREVGSRAMIAANTITKHKNMILEAWNSNAIDSDLQRHVILQDMLEAYALNLLPLEAFSVKYENIPLQGDDTVAVPYFPLQGTASTQFVKGTGYTTASDWTENSRKVVIGGDGASATSGTNATAGTAKDRLYQMINFTSYDMRRQPYLVITKLAQQAANKLAVDVCTQIYSRVIVVGNFATIAATVAAAAFSPDNIADLNESADAAEWPAIARSLVLNHTYKTPLLKDPTFKSALAYGSTDPIRKAMIQEAYGFQDMYFVPNLSGKLAANTGGWINHKSAVLVAFAPILPTPEVRNLLTQYDIVVDPKSGAVLEYRKFGDAIKDQSSEVIESNFGAAKGVDAALQIIKSA